jgi:hypothetical protein
LSIDWLCPTFTPHDQPSLNTLCGPLLILSVLGGA